jgi:hypothetical protein
MDSFPVSSRDRRILPIPRTCELPYRFISPDRKDDSITLARRKEAFRSSEARGSGGDAMLVVARLECRTDIRKEPIFSRIRRRFFFVERAIPQVCFGQMSQRRSILVGGDREYPGELGLSIAIGHRIDHRPRSGPSPVHCISNASK